MNTIYYQVDVRDPQTGYWSSRAKFRPPYDITTTTNLHEWFCFVWETVDKDIANQQEAEDEARVEAIRFAQELTDHSVRVQKCRGYGWSPMWILVWEDGKFKDC